MNTFKAVLVESAMLTPANKHLRFLPEKPLAFRPGQYVFIEFSKGESSILRAYSIASSPNEDHLDLCVTRVENGPGSTLLHAAKPGDAFAMKGPAGRFLLEKSDKDIVFFATGSGVAPFRSMVRFAFEEGWTNKIHLVFGVRHEEDIIYRKEWEELAGSNPNFTFIPTLSRPDGAWQGERGYVQTKVHRFPKDSRVYICGLKKMVGETTVALLAAGFRKGQIFVEKYD